MIKYTMAMEKAVLNGIKSFKGKDLSPKRVDIEAEDVTFEYNNIKYHFDKVSVHLDPTDKINVSWFLEQIVPTGNQEGPSYYGYTAKTFNSKSNFTQGIRFGNVVPFQKNTVPLSLESWRGIIYNAAGQFTRRTHIPVDFIRFPSFGVID
jgi:hypothetical protein